MYTILGIQVLYPIVVNTGWTRDDTPGVVSILGSIRYALNMIHLKNM